MTHYWIDAESAGIVSERAAVDHRVGITERAIADTLKAVRVALRCPDDTNIAEFASQASHALDDIGFVEELLRSLVFELSYEARDHAEILKWAAYQAARRYLSRRERPMVPEKGEPRPDQGQGSC